jgi:hypothetical protein
VAGRPAADPALLLALWLYATVENVGSARALELRVERDIAYRWIMGGVSVNYHGLSDFRVGHGELLDRLLTESVTALMAAGLVSLDEVIADGTKVKASAGVGSYGGASRFERIERIAHERIARLRAETEADPGASTRRAVAAKERAARDLAERAQRAAAALAELKREKARRAKSNPTEEAQKGEPRASLTDPEARPMRFADGSVKAGYNIQVVAASNGFVLALAATSRRNDLGLARPMMDEIKARYHSLPKRLLLDTKYAAEADIVDLAEDPLGPVTVYTPVPGEVPGDQVKPDTLRRRLARRAKEHQALKDWRARMNTSQGRDIFRKRRRIETVNAWFKAHGLARLTLRGLAKAKIAGLLQALAHNLMLAHHYRTRPA